MKISRKYLSWKESFFNRIQYGTMSRRPFFDLACDFIPRRGHPVIVDIGCGEGEFAKTVRDTLGLDSLLIDANKNTVIELKKTFHNVICHKLPEPIPIKSCSVDFIHCSHVLEHMPPGHCYTSLREFDRILKVNGFICISGPIYWEGFYYDLSHVRPYYPETFIRYMCGKGKNYTRKPLTARYRMIKLVYRYHYNALFNEREGLMSEWQIIDLLLQAAKKIMDRLMRLRYFTVNGYTLILQKKG